MSIVRHSYVIASLFGLYFATSDALHAAEFQSATAGADPAAPQIALDLRPPDLDEIYSPQQIAELLSRPFSDIEEVHVEGVRLESLPSSATPAIPGGLEAVFWSVPNLAQAWRIFMPISSDQVIPFSEALDAVVHAPPTALPARDPATFP